ncbi:hypothetical protein [Nonomuraea salmonea]|uniref:hypothetical protein n=1 Tax=Nonomuraea salmonea TaxID=46181 RepID=UPI0031E5EE6A
MPSPDGVKSAAMRWPPSLAWPLVTWRPGRKIFSSRRSPSSRTPVSSALLGWSTTCSARSDVQTGRTHQPGLSLSPAGRSGRPMEEPRSRPVARAPRLQNTISARHVVASGTPGRWRMRRRTPWTMPRTAPRQRSGQGLSSAVKPDQS